MKRILQVHPYHRCRLQSDHMERSDLAKRFFIARWERERAERERERGEREGGAGA
jgi:hypothetical protein